MAYIMSSWERLEALIATTRSKIKIVKAEAFSLKPNPNSKAKRSVLHGMLHPNYTALILRGSSQCFADFSNRAQKKLGLGPVQAFSLQCTTLRLRSVLKLHMP